MDKFFKLIEDVEVRLSQQELQFLNHVQRQWLRAMSLWYRKEVSEHKGNAKCDVTLTYIVK